MFKLLAIAYIVWLLYSTGAWYPLYYATSRRDAGQRLIAWLLWLLPHYPAVWLAHKLVRGVPHDPVASTCVPCHASERIRHAAHSVTHGPHSDYCSKCGLRQSKWPRYCANRVVHVNNKRKKKASDRFRPIFW